MGEGTGPDEIERLLELEARTEIPPPPADLVPRTIRRVRNWLLVGDLLRLVTLEALWSRANGDGDGALGRQERQDP